MKALKLVGNRIAVEIQKKGETITKGGIALPDQAVAKMCMCGKVVAIGPGEWSEKLGRPLPMTVRVGDIVAIDEYGAREIEVEGEKVTITHEGNVLAIL